MIALSWNPAWFQFCVICRRRFRCGGLSPASSWWIWIGGQIRTGPAGVATCGWHQIIPAGWKSETARWGDAAYDAWLKIGRSLNSVLRVIQRKPPTFYRPPGDLWA